jgi:hypothetical protein
MSDQTTEPDNFQHFSITVPGTVTFARATSGIILTVDSNNTTVAFGGEGGTPVMALRAGTYQFLNLRMKTIVFGGSGNVSGSGYCT